MVNIIVELFKGHPCFYTFCLIGIIIALISAIDSFIGRIKAHIKSVKINKQVEYFNSGYTLCFYNQKDYINFYNVLRSSPDITFRQISNRFSGEYVGFVHVRG